MINTETNSKIGKRLLFETFQSGEGVPVRELSEEEAQQYIKEQKQKESGRFANAKRKKSGFRQRLEEAQKKREEQNRQAQETVDTKKALKKQIRRSVRDTIDNSEDQEFFVILSEDGELSATAFSLIESNGSKPDQETKETKRLRTLSAQELSREIAQRLRALRECLTTQEEQKTMKKKFKHNHKVCGCGRPYSQKDLEDGMCNKCYAPTM